MYTHSIFYVAGQNQLLKQLVCQSKISWYTVKAIYNAYETRIVMIIVEENYECEFKKILIFHLSPSYKLLLDLKV